MSIVKRSALVPYSAAKMYELVNNVVDYPQFLPGCVAGEIISASDQEMIARVNVAKMGITNTFTTHNFLQKNHSIIIDLVDGPFKKLHGEWTFIELLEDACKIEFWIDFEFKNQLISMAFSNLFKDLVGGMVQAFTQRAKQIYYN